MKLEQDIVRLEQAAALREVRVVIIIIISIIILERYKSDKMQSACGSIDRVRMDVNCSVSV